MNSLSEIEIHPNNSLLEALKQMDRIERKLLIVSREGIFEGLLSIGDIQRAMLNSADLNLPLSGFMRKTFKAGNVDESKQSIKEKMISHRMEFYPIINPQGHVNEIVFWEDLFGQEKLKPKESFNLPIVIMAGGKGTRLKPLTNVLPKPLIPIGEKTMLEEIFAKFTIYGCNKFYISVNYKADLIEYYINQLDLDLAISFFREEIPLGTAGSLSLLRGKIKSTFFVSNCDILIEEDYSEVLNFHKTNNYELTIFGAIQNIAIPYGTLDTNGSGKLVDIHEKPNINFIVNTGLYIVEPHLLSEIPDEEEFQITQLIANILKRDGKVGVFPVSQKSWKDVGIWSEYNANMLD